MPAVPSNKLLLAAESQQLKSQKKKAKEKRGAGTGTDHASFENCGGTTEDTTRTAKPMEVTGTYSQQLNKANEATDIELNTTETRQHQQTKPRRIRSFNERRPDSILGPTTPVVLLKVLPLIGSLLRLCRMPAASSCLSTGTSPARYRPGCQRSSYRPRPSTLLPSTGTP